MRDLIGVNLVKGIGVGIDVETPNLEKDIDANMADLVAKMKGTVDYEKSRSIPVSSIVNTYNTYNDKSFDNNTPIIIRNINQTILDGDIIAEKTTDRVIDNIGDQQESYEIAKGW